MKLFCFPYAGASATVYARWRRCLPDWLEVKPVELPGRGMRFDEPPQSDLNALAGQLADELRPATGGRYALFGHSLGALLALEVAHRLAADPGGTPSGLFVSGTHAPSRRDTTRYARLRTDRELIAELRRLNGTPPEVLDNPEFLALTLPVLRADFALCADYRHRSRPPLGCALHVFGGTRDETTPDTLGAWREETHGDFFLDILDGDHFFIRQREDEVLGLIRGYAERLAGGERP